MAKKRAREAATLDPRPVYRFRLYVTGMTPRSVTAIENMRRLCEHELAGRYQLEIVDIYQHPELATEAQVVAAPTLIKELPAPLRRFIGDLSDIEAILVELGETPVKE